MRAVGEIFVLCGIFIAIAIVVIYEARHEDSYGWAVDWMISGSVGLPIKGVEEDTAIEVPNGRAGLAALSSSVNRRLLAVGEISVGYPHMCFDSVDHSLERSALNGGDAMVESSGSADDASQVYDNPVITGRGVVQEFEMVKL
jgi:hypothetical protein